MTNGQGEMWPIRVSTYANGHLTIVVQAPADLVDIAIAMPDGAGSWERHQLPLAADTIWRQCGIGFQPVTGKPQRQAEA